MSERSIRNPRGIASPTRAQLREVRRILYWPRDKAFARCPGKNKKFLAEREAEGDYSHSDKQHLCDDCRCKKRAGQGTRGDFYGLGIETGHIGVGYCYYHEQRMPTAQVLKVADAQMRRIQKVGHLEMDKLTYTNTVKEDARLAQLSLRAKQDLELVVDTLNDFKEALNTTGMNELAGGKLVDMSDATRIKLQLDIAKTLSKIKLDHFKLDSNSYLHYDELKIRIPQMMNLASNLFEELREMVMTNEENAVERVGEKWTKGLSEIWTEVKTGAR